MTDPNPLHHHWRPATWIRVTGEDAFGFLQGQFSNDLRKLGEQIAVYGLWLDEKGKVLADSFVLRGSTETEFWLGSYFCPAASIRERLEKYIVADDVALQDETSGWWGTTLTGGERRPLAAESEAVRIFPARRGIPGAWERVTTAFKPEMGGPGELSASEMERTRVRGGVPRIPDDVGPGDLPQEAGLERDAISYEKGCFLGQEVMARLRHLGAIKRQLHPISGEMPPPHRGTALYQDGRAVGEVRSVAPEGAGFVAFAMLHVGRCRIDQSLSIEPDGPAAIRILK